MIPSFKRESLHETLIAALRKLVGSKDFPPGQQFFTERQVAEKFAVSRITANKALAALVGEGLLEFRKGVGTFVAQPKYDYNLRSLVSFTKMVEAHGGKAETKVLSLRKVKQGPASLELGSGESCFYTERLRLANGTPVILEKRWIREKYCPNLTKADLKGSLYELFTQKYFLDVAGAEQVIRAVLLDEESAQHLQAKRGGAALLNRSTGYLQERIPLWYEETLYRGDAYEFFNRLGSIEQPRPAEGRLIS